MVTTYSDALSIYEEMDRQGGQHKAMAGERHFTMFGRNWHSRDTDCCVPCSFDFWVFPLQHRNWWACFGPGSSPFKPGWQETDWLE